MKTVLRLLIAVIVLVLLLGAGLWWYLFGPNAIEGAQLVPGDTLVYLTIPNAAKVTSGYQSSQLKKLADAPEAKPLIDSALTLIGEKNRALIEAFLPNLSGQSFIALTHFDPDHPGDIGFIAAMKPKSGLGNFDAFVEKLKATYPEFISQGKAGTGNVAGVDYQSLQGPGGMDKICVAKYQGWIVTTWGEASLRDWLERVQKKSSTPSLAENTDYKKSLERVGKDSMAIVYANYHGLLGSMQKALAKTDPAQSEYMMKKLAGLGALAIGTRFEQGDIMDRFSFLMSPDAIADSGMLQQPCAFDTLKFTDPDTRFYWAFNTNLPFMWKKLQDPNNATPQMGAIVAGLEALAKNSGLDLQRNIIDALGHEISLQVEWSNDATYPDAGLFVKIDKPDDFKPTINAILDFVRKNYSDIGMLNEFKVDNHSYATLKFIQASPFNPTITEDGDYFGIFLTESHAASVFKREGSGGLLHNTDFVRQIGDKRNGAAQILFLDAPKLLDRGYRTALPYLSIAAMLNKTVAASLKDHQLPSDLNWLAPMGTWSFVTSLDNGGVQGYSVSGAGNQGIYILASIGATASALQSMGVLPHSTPGNFTPAPSGALPISPSTAPATSPDTNDMTPPAASPDATSPSPAAPATPSSNATPSTPEQPSTNQ